MQRKFSRNLNASTGAIIAGLVLAGCGGGGNGGTPATPKYTVGVTISGLNAGTNVILQNNQGDNLTVSGNGSAAFATALASGSAYSVSILTQPSGETCSVASASGTISNANASGAAVTCTPNPHFAYVTTCGGGVALTNLVPGEISSYSLNEATGSISAIGSDVYQPQMNPATVSATVIDPAGRFLYAAENAYIGPGFISAYAINPLTGALAEISGSPFTSGLTIPSSSPSPAQPKAIAIMPNDTFALVTNTATNTVSVFSINANTGALTPISNSPFATGSSPVAVAINPKTNFAYVLNSSSNTLSVYAIDPAAGTLSPVAGSPFAVDTNSPSLSNLYSPNTIAVSPNGNFVYVINGNSNSVSAFAVNTATGALTPVSGSPFNTGTNPRAIAIAPNGNTVYITNGATAVTAYSVNSTTGALTSAFVMNTNFATEASSMTITQNGLFAYVISPGSIGTGQPGVITGTPSDVAIYSLNPNTGAMTLAGDAGPILATTCSIATN